MSNYELMARKTYVSWQEIDSYASQLAGYVRKNGYAGVYGVPKGGLILAVMVAYRAGVPLLMAPEKGCIVVDEITATGKALENYLGRYDIAVMYRFAGSSVTPVLQYRDVEDEWIVFPWE